VWDKALTYCRQAGTKALAGSAYREAVGYWEQALEALAHLPPERPMLEQAIDLHHDLYVSLVPLAQYEQMLMHLREAETVAEGLGDQRRLGRICRRTASLLRQMQDYGPALAYCQRTHTIATALGDVDLQLVINLEMGESYFDLGDYHRSMACLQQILTAFQGERLYQSFGGPALPSVQARAYMIWCISELGEFANGLTYGAEALQIAEAVNRPYERLSVYSRVGYLHVRQGTLHRAIPLLERAVALSRDTDIPFFYRISAPWLALAYALAGRATDALPLLGQIERYPVVRGEAYLLAGEVEEADRLAQPALANARDRKTRGQEARALWLLGEIAMRRDPPDVAQAETHYQ
jgi:tetratricopeptide (TPR) repeat protein